MSNTQWSLARMGEDWVPVHHATLVFVCAHDRVLLIRKKRGLGAGKINGPGGKLDPGETPHQCAVREVQEELHITPLNLAPHGELKFQFIDDYSIHVHVFLADSYDGEPTETDEALPLWFAPQSIPYDEMWADDAIWLPRVLEGAVVAGRFVFDGDCMLEHEVGYT